MYRHCLDLLVQELPGYEQLRAAVILVAIDGPPGSITDVLETPPMDVIKNVMSVYATGTRHVRMEDIHRWDALGLTLADYPRLMNTALREYYLRRELYATRPHLQRNTHLLPTERQVVAQLMARGLRLPPNHVTGLGWIKAILVLLAAPVGKAPGTPRVSISRLPCDLVRMLAGFIRDRV